MEDHRVSQMENDGLMMEHGGLNQGKLRDILALF
jgi:hypothetical protein